MPAWLRFLILLLGVIPCLLLLFTGSVLVTSGVLVAVLGYCVHQGHMQASVAILGVLYGVLTVNMSVIIFVAMDNKNDKNMTTNTWSLVRLLKWSLLRSIS